MYGLEVHSHILWWIFAIDTHSVLSGSGSGDFAKSMLGSDRFLPPTTYFAISSTEYSDRESLDSRNAPSVLEFHRAILVMAARLGLLARDIRQSISQAYDRHGPEMNVHIMQREQRVMHFRDKLRRIWDMHFPTFAAMDYSNDSVPIKARGIFEHVSLFTRSICMLTSFEGICSCRHASF